MAQFLKNRDFLEQDINGAIVFHLDQQPARVFNVQKDGDITVIEGKSDDPATVLEPDPQFPDTWKKARFAELGKGQEKGTDLSLIHEAEGRFCLSYADILKTKRTIGAMTTVAFVFDDRSVQLAVVQRAAKGPEGTVNMGALSRFGGGACGGKDGKGVHGAQHLGNQTIREFMEEFHPYIRSEAGVLTPVNIIPQGYEIDGLKGEFMRAVMANRAGIAAHINQKLEETMGVSIKGQETMAAVPLSVDGLTGPVIQIIDGQQVLHENIVTFDAQVTNSNLDFNTDMLFAVRVQGVRPEDFVLKDGETDQKTGALLDRIIFFGDPADLKRAVNGEIIRFHAQSDMSKPAQFSPAFKPILQKAEYVTQAALGMC